MLMAWILFFPLRWLFRTYLTLCGYWLWLTSLLPLHGCHLPVGPQGICSCPLASGTLPSSNSIPSAVIILPFSKTIRPHLCSLNNIHMSLLCIQMTWNWCQRVNLLFNHAIQLDVIYMYLYILKLPVADTKQQNKLRHSKHNLQKYFREMKINYAKKVINMQHKLKRRTNSAVNG